MNGTPSDSASDNNGVDEREGPLGDVIPDRKQVDPRTRGGQPPEKVEDRPVVGRTVPEDYPEEERTRGR